MECEFLDRVGGHSTFDPNEKRIDRGMALYIDVIIWQWNFKNHLPEQRPFEDVNEAVQLSITAQKIFRFRRDIRLHLCGGCSAILREKALGLACACCLDCIFTMYLYVPIRPDIFRRITCRALRPGSYYLVIHIARTN